MLAPVRGWAILDGVAYSGEGHDEVEVRPAAGTVKDPAAELDVRAADARAPGESEERYRQLVELVPDAVAIHAGGRLVFVNEAAARLLGAGDRAALLGRPVLDFVHPSSRDAVAARMRRAAGGERLPPMEELLVRADGGALAVEASAAPCRFEGRPAVMVALRDLTATRRTERIQSALFRIAELTSVQPDMAAFYASIHAIVSELMYAHNFYIALRDEEGGTIHFPYFADAVDPNPGRIDAGKTLTGWVLRTGRPMLVPPEVFQEMVDRGDIELVGSPSLDWLGVPLRRGDEVFGVLVVQSYTERRRYGAADCDLLTFVSQHVASAIDRKRAADALRESEAKFRTLAGTTPVATFIAQGGALRYVNAAMEALTGYRRDELLRMSLADLVHPAHRERLPLNDLAPVEAASDGGEILFTCKDGGGRWLALSTGYLEYEGRPALLVSAFDTTERRRVEEQVRDLAFQDPLTGLPNRRLFVDRLQLAVAQAHRTVQPLAVFFLDLDRFKSINDTLGHGVGDQILIEVGRRLRESVREGDTVARLGGDEFILLLPGVGRPEDVNAVAGKLLEGFRAPFLVAGSELAVTASLGVSVFPGDGGGGEALLRSADTAMYRAKQEGRATWRLHKPAA